LRQIPRPDAGFEVIELGGKEIAQAVLHLVGRATRPPRTAAPSPDTDSALARVMAKIASRQMHFCQGLADAGAMRHVGFSRPDAFEEIDDDGGRPASVLRGLAPVSQRLRTE
jgi:hypothetical protein